jgi:hypothetical protein
MAPSFLSQGIDYLGFLDAKLRDLQGYATLAHELIQNADDAKASAMSFDIRDDALVVENNSTFSDCGAVEAAECPWKEQPGIGHRCDFHRFRKVAGGDKREQEATTGAFGIGFISVYQITDRPELISGHRYWRIRPEESEDRRIEVVPREGSPHDGTRFILAWASDAESVLRKRLRVQTVQTEQVSQTLLDVLGHALPNAILFLKHVNKIELRRNGLLIKKIDRIDEGDQILIQDGDLVRLWRILQGSFDAEAENLRQAYPTQIEGKRTSSVAVAIPDNTIGFTGLFSAWLPTEQQTELPFHINADFYPSTDRKHVLLTNDYQGAWNRAAIRAAAELVAKAIPTLPSLLGHVDLWALFERLKAVNDSSKSGILDPIYEAFWNYAQPQVVATASVATSTNAWCLPSEVYLLERPEEETHLPLLEQIGLQLVHPDLRRFYSLLRGLGVRQFTLGDLARELLDAGLDDAIDIEDAPLWIRPIASREQLGREIEILSEQRVRREVLEAAQQLIRRCAIALARDGWLSPPAELFKASADIVAVLEALDQQEYILAEENPSSIAALVPELQPEGLLSVLETVDRQEFEKLWLERKNLLLVLIDWFVNHRTAVMANDVTKARVRALPIWPSDHAVHPLDDLVVPGTFEAPIQVASVLNHQVYSSRRDFLRELGAARLNLRTYAADFIPRAFTAGRMQAPGDIRRLVAMLAEHVGELHDFEEVRDALTQCKLIECTDGVFRSPLEVYFDTEVIRAGFADLPIAVAPPERQEAILLLYEWLGVASEPRLSDVVTRVKQIVTDAPNEERRNVIAALFRHLSVRDISPDDGNLQVLRNMRWLPARNDETRWYAPSELYTVFRDYLFSTQAKFLGFERPLQSNANKLMELLGVKSNPTTEQVVGHLLTCAATSQPVNPEVYSFLNDHADEKAVERLRGKACLRLHNGKYVLPEHVFWGEHGFGRYRYRLDATLRNRDRLFSRLGVRELPQAADALSVMEEISLSFQNAQIALDAESCVVMMTCWRYLSEALERGEINADLLSKLQEMPLVPTVEGHLRPPLEIFFEDRPGIADGIPNFKDRFVVSRVSGAWRAMDAAGVRPLSKAVRVELSEASDRRVANDLLARIAERRHLIARVLEAVPTVVEKGLDISLLDTLHIYKVSRLEIFYFIRVAGRPWSSAPRDVTAHFDLEHAVLYVQPSSRLWPALARELAYALNPHGESIQLAAGLKEILSADTSDGAAEALTELGYAELVVDQPPPAAGEIIDIGGEAAPSESEAAPSGAGVDETRTTSTHERAAANGTAEQVSGNGLRPVTPPSPSHPASAGSDKNGNAASATDASTGGITAGAQEQGTEEGHDDYRGTRGSDRKNGSGRAKSARRGRLRTYVVPAREGKPGAGEDVTERISAVDAAGIRRVLEFERDAGRYPEEMPHGNPGYDIESKDATGAIIRYIEVKSLADEWDSLGVALSYPQFSQAHLYGEQFWLYVVERAEHEDGRVYPIRDPARRVDQFFYDDGWRNLAETELVVPLIDRATSESS